jgi:putative transcriptional regulator
MAIKNKKLSRLAQTLLETAKDMRQVGVLDDAAFDKITMRHLGPEEKEKPQPLSGKDIRLIRKRAHMSQAVFAHHLNVTMGYVSQLERGAKRPTGAALALLNVIRRKGIHVIF